MDRRSRGKEGKVGRLGGRRREGGYQREKLSGTQRDQAGAGSRGRGKGEWGDGQSPKEKAKESRRGRREERRRGEG